MIFHSVRPYVNATACTVFSVGCAITPPTSALASSAISERSPVDGSRMYRAPVFRSRLSCMYTFRPVLSNPPSPVVNASSRPIVWNSVSVPSFPNA